jgi:hypothetical protein
MQWLSLMLHIWVGSTSLAAATCLWQTNLQCLPSPHTRAKEGHSSPAYEPTTFCSARNLQYTGTKGTILIMPFADSAPIVNTQDWACIPKLFLPFGIFRRSIFPEKMIITMSHCSSLPLHKIVITFPYPLTIPGLPFIMLHTQHT